jgi:hypothetical protein
MWLRRAVDHPRLFRTESYGSLGFVHRFRLEDPKHIDEAVIKLLGEAYIVGQQE